MTTPDSPAANSETVLANGTAHAIEVRPLTLLCHDGSMRIEVPGRVEITPILTVQHADAIGQDYLDLAHRYGLTDLLRRVFPALPMPATVAQLRNQGMGMRHCVGLFTLLMECSGRDAPVFLRLPETYLHPSAQTGLADALIRGLGIGGGASAHEAMSNRAFPLRFREFAAAVDALPERAAPSQP